MHTSCTFPSYFLYFLLLTVVCGTIMFSLLNDWLSPSANALRAQAVELLSFQGYTSLLQAFLFAVILYATLTRAYLPRWSRDGAGIPEDDANFDAEIAAKIAAWKPEPLAPPLPPGDVARPRVVLKGAAGPIVDVVLDGDGDVAFPGTINLSSLNYLGLVGDHAITKACADTLKKYGCGACGPRGFYGTVDVHLKCEAALASFFGTDDAILYSFGSSTGPSVIPAFCKRGDLVVCDKGISFGLQTGVQLSRADCLWFEHNDMADLERALCEATKMDAKNPSLATRQRRFIIVEGLYANFGSVAPLDKIVALKNKYNFRLILDESHSLGALGATGRGALEHFGIGRKDVEIATADLGNALATIGGVCVGEPQVVSHQRLSGAGYCFSASQPPFLATAATQAVAAIELRGKGLISRARDNKTALVEALQLTSLRSAGWEVESGDASPLLHIRAARGASVVLEEDFVTIQRKCLAGGVLVAAPAYVETEAFRPRPSLRLAVAASHDAAQMRKAGDAVRAALLSVRSTPGKA